MNKYEKNISNIITLKYTEDIIYDFYRKLETVDKTLGIIANRELIEFTMNEILKNDFINVRRVDLEIDDTEYMLSVDINGDLVVQPVWDCRDEYFKNIEIAYISMDGDVSQVIIDNCIDRDVEVILFGYEDDDINECTYGECKCACKETEKKPVGKTASTSSMVYKVNGEIVSKEDFDTKMEHFEKKYLNNIRGMFLDYCELMDEFNEWSKLFRW